MMTRNLSIEDMLRVLGFLAIFAFLLIDPLGIVASDALAEDEVNAGAAGQAPAAPPTPAAPGGSKADYGGIVDILSMIFILAVLIEIGLSVLFKWRVFLRFAEGRGLKVPIAFVVSLAIVMTHSIDLPAAVVATFDMNEVSGSEVGYFISALIIAGGSSSVNGIFEKLGWRNPVPQTRKAEAERQKDRGRLWVAIERTQGGTSDGQAVTVSIDGQQVALLAPTESTSGGSEGHSVSQGTRKIQATWTTSQGTEQKLERDVFVAAGKGMTEKLTLA